MPGRLRRFGVGIFIVIIALVAFRAQRKARVYELDLKLEHAPEGQYRRKIVAIGDLHGDWNNTLRVLQLAKVVDEHERWSGQIDYFVQTGDIIDRGDDTIKLFSYFEKLRSQALQHGGQVLSHLGNHEWMNLFGDWRYVYPSEIRTFGSVEARQRALASGRIGKTWRTNYTTTSRLPLHPSTGIVNADFDPSLQSVLSHSALSFVHGGLSPSFPWLSPYPSAINELASSLLHKAQSRRPFPPPHPPNPNPGLPEDATDPERYFYGEDGPVWFRGWAMAPEDVVCRAIDPVLDRLGVRRMIMGHTPNFERIVSRCEGKIIIIDTGISHAYGGALSALFIDYTLTPLETPLNDATAPTLSTWMEREVIKALYTDHEEVLAVSERNESSSEGASLNIVTVSHSKSTASMSKRGVPDDFACKIPQRLLSVIATTAAITLATLSIP